MKKIWKGLFYAMWHADFLGRPGRARRTDGRPRAQTQAQGGSLLRRRLLHHRAPRVGRHRPSSMDKYLLLVRRCHQPLPPVLRRPRLVRERRRGRRRVPPSHRARPGGTRREGRRGRGPQTSPRRALCPRTPESGGGTRRRRGRMRPGKGYRGERRRASNRVPKETGEER